MSISSRSARSFSKLAALILIAFLVLFNFFQDRPPIQKLGEQLELKPSEIDKVNSSEEVDSLALQEEATKAISETNLGKAEKIYHQILEAEPENIQALYGLGVVSLQAGDANKATEIFHDVFNLEPEKIQEVLADPRLEGIRSSSYFQDLLRMHDISIPEMNSHMNSPPLPPE